MDPDSSLLAIIIPLLFSAFFSGMEIAFVSSNKLHIELMKKRGEFNARILSYFLENHLDLLPPCLLETILPW